MSSISGNSQTFHSWLSSTISPYIRDDHGWVLWYDAPGEWRDILRKFSESEGIEYWDGEEIHEFTLRYDLYKRPYHPRIIRLPINDHEVTWFAIAALKAPLIKQERLAKALRSFGAEISWEREQEMGDTIRSYALQWFDESKDAWKGKGSDSIMTDSRVLEIIAPMVGKNSN